MIAKVYYQDFNLNALTIVNKELKLERDKAVLVSKDIQVNDEMLEEHKINFLEKIYHTFNKLSKQFKEQILDINLFKKVGHTSMSIGDFVEFSNGEIWICDVVGWKKI